VSRIPPDENIPLPLEETASFSTMSTLFRTMAQRPEIMQHSMQLLDTVMRTGSVELRLKELLAVRVSQVNYCFY
jgi:alkylhydroperoxidase family enzyme